MDMESIVMKSTTLGRRYHGQYLPSQVDTKLETLILSIVMGDGKGSSNRKFKTLQKKLLEQQQQRKQQQQQQQRQQQQQHGILPIVQKTTGRKNDIGHF